MFHQNIGVDDMNEFPALGTPSNNNRIMQRTYASTVQDPAYHRARAYNTTSPHFTRHDFPILTRQFNPSHDTGENTNTTKPDPSHVGPWGQEKSNETLPQAQVTPSAESITPMIAQDSTQTYSYMLLDVEDILRGTEPDRTMMVTGNDFSMLRLNLSSPHSIYPEFLSPWSDIQNLPGFPVELGYRIPMSYYEVKAFPPAQERISSFSDEGLFYMFYSTPNDITQMKSAKELFNRNWRYSKELQVWIAGQVNEQGKVIKAIEPISESEQIVQGLFIVFDPIQWKREKRELTFVWQTIELNPFQ